MAQLHRLRLWFVLVLVVVLISAAVLWLRAMLVSGPVFTSPIPPPLRTAEGESPLPTPTSASPTSAAVSISTTGAVAVLLWVALGVVLALGITFVILRWYRRAT
jgi:uncharacterized membrane protein SpoIIM required for sporulation